MTPPLPRTARTLEIRDRLVRLHRLNIGPAVLQVYAATPYDLELLAIAEDELNRKPEDPHHGRGCEMDSDC